jgi:hypothetical protein
MKDDASFWRPILALFVVGSVMVACILLGYVLGSAWDGKDGGDAGKIAGVLVGTLAGFVQMFLAVRHFLFTDRERKR